MAQAAERQDEPVGLYITDTELYRRLGLPRDKARVTIDSLDKNGASGFPKKQPLFGNRRYWPAVKAFLDRLNGIKLVDR